MCVAVGTLKHAIFTSSLLVCELGYIPTHEVTTAPQISMAKASGKGKCSFENRVMFFRLHGLSFDQPQSGGPWFEMLNLAALLAAFMCIPVGKTLTSRIVTSGTPLFIMLKDF